MSPVLIGQIALPSIPALIALVAIPLLGWQGAKWLFRFDTKTEQRRRGAAELAGVLRSWGLVRTSEFLLDYSVGDYSSMGHKIAELVRLFTSGEAAVAEEFNAVFERVLEQKIKDPDGRTVLAARLRDAMQPDDPKVVTEIASQIVKPSS